MAYKASWTGTVGFGMVSVPVASTPAVREQSPSFNQVHEVVDEATGEVSLNPVGRKMYDKVTDEEVAWGDIMRGYTASNGAVVRVEDADLEGLAPDRGKHIEIEKFIDLADVDAKFFAKNEYAWAKAPTKGGVAGAGKAYALLVRALETTGKAGFGYRTSRGKNSPVLVRADHGVMVITTLYWDDEVAAPESIGVEPSAVSDAETNMAIALVSAMGGDWKPAELVDEYRENVVAMLEAKSEGKAPQVTEAPKKEVVTDLMAALAASVEASKKAKVAK
jgi:DNA end-binding protein Ku